ncbi:hypothetical protein [Pseudomonas citronellolis]|uniref:hypothetical protein n=1 Tax=Pseudomonas citronellolis TaxID=53408 RepID=UPI0023E479CD|nr:hypothetical protein [Pseudomonas citronellolis]MDF3936910.1 hypothetical protein [Pseudomonas citronellolis]
MSSVARPLVVIFGGANERAVVAFCRSLQREGVEFHVVARNARDPLYLTSYRERIVARREHDQLDPEEFRAILLRLREQYPGRRLCIAPSAESINRLLLGMADWLHEQGIQGVTVSEEVYLRFSEKERCLATAAEFGLRLPEVHPGYEARYLPLVLKPRCEYAANGERLYPLLVRTAEEFQRYAEAYSAERYLVQRYLDGQSFYYFYYRNGAGVARLYQRNLAQQAAGKSIVAAELVECPDNETDQRLRTLLEHHDYRGFIMFEVMRCDGHDYLIEANPRLWGPMQLALDNGFRASWLGLPDDQAPHLAAAVKFCGLWSRRGYFWLGGFVGQRLADMRFFAARGRLLRRFLCCLPRYDIWLAGDSYRLFISELKKVGLRR